MKKRNALFILLLLTSCGEKQVKAPLKQEKAVVPEQITLKTSYPVEARLKEGGGDENGVLTAKVDQQVFTLLANGSLSWGKNSTDTFRLAVDKWCWIEKVFLHMSGDTLFAFYTETDSEGAGSMFEKIDLKNKKRLLKTAIEGFNLGKPAIRGQYVYVTAIGSIGKLNLNTGKYAYSDVDLYDREKYSFNSFDTIVFRRNETIFVSKNYHSGHMDSVIVNEQTGKKRIVK